MIGFNSLCCSFFRSAFIGAKLEVLAQFLRGEFLLCLRDRVRRCSVDIEAMGGVLAGSSDTRSTAYASLSPI